MINCFFPFVPVRLELINSLFEKKQFNRKHAAPDGAFLEATSMLVWYTYTLLPAITALPSENIQ